MNIFVVKLDQKNKKTANDPQHVEDCCPRNVKKICRSKCGNALGHQISKLIKFHFFGFCDMLKSPFDTIAKRHDSLSFTSHRMTQQEQHRCDQLEEGNVRIEHGSLTRLTKFQ
jgi:hypothetical protein